MIDFAPALCANRQKVSIQKYIDYKLKSAGDIEFRGRVHYIVHVCLDLHHVHVDLYMGGSILYIDI